MRVLTSKIAVLWTPPAQDRFICDRNKIGVAGERKPGTEGEEGLEGVVGMAKAWETCSSTLLKSWEMWRVRNTEMACGRRGVRAGADL